ncbi:MAG: DNA mismatch repair endonuclease MutL [Pseudomonadota bacterium]
MNAPDNNIQFQIPQIRQLSDAAANRIAAGEVVERPSSAVKELIENALDAGSTKISVEIAHGGKSLIRVTDDGHGIAADQLPLALSRHATSKIDGQDLVNIRSFGFRGEALPSLGAVGRLTIMSRADRASEAFEISVEGGAQNKVKPAALSKGTVVVLRDLFFATPARLKFMRTDRAETQAISDVVKRLALAEPGVSFTLSDRTDPNAPRILFDAAVGGHFQDGVRDHRIGQILGRSFVENAVPIHAPKEGITLSGLASLPTYSRGSAAHQYIFVNGRPVRDKTLSGALRGAYADFLSRDRHALVVLYLLCDPQSVDVNVHPAKSEVRFRDAGAVRGLMVSGIRHALAEAGHRASSSVSEAMLGTFTSQSDEGPRIYQMPLKSMPRAIGDAALTAPPQMAEVQSDYSARVIDMPEEATDHPLGAARAQLHENYIISQTETGIVIVDQHAAHERLVYEQLKERLLGVGVPSQALLIPEVIHLSPSDRDLILSYADDLRATGLEVEAFGGSAICVQATPAILGQVDPKALLQDVLDELLDQPVAATVQTRIDAVLSRMSCHGSVRSGRQMRGEEMNALLRQMEATPYSGQCNHGRPTYVELQLSDIEKLFGRK